MDDSSAFPSYLVLDPVSSLGHFARVEDYLSPRLLLVLYYLRINMIKHITQVVTEQAVMILSITASCAFTLLPPTQPSHHPVAPCQGCH